MIKIAPSLLSADFSRLQEQLKAIETGGADWVHIDVMDGQFVPNLTFGPKIVQAIKQLTMLPLDVHLMVREPDHLIPSFIQAGADFVTVHVEAIRHINRTLSLIRDHGASPGVTLNPGTSVTAIDALYADIELILVMTVNPGFGGQKFIPSTLSKIKQISDQIRSTGRDILLEVDGGIDLTTAPLVVNAGADVLVAGNAIFNTPDVGAAIQTLRSSLT